MDHTELQSLFETAIGREIEAQEFYGGVAAKVSDQAVKEIFLQLAKEEKGHEDLLAKLRSDPNSSLRFKPPPDYMVAEATELPEISLEMKPADAIALAMKKEQQAMEFYQGLASWCEDEAMGKMYQNLAVMESNHKHRLETLFVDIGYPEAW
jgi:rubrerythrin